MQTCIICRKKKADFNDEHVIPDSIQGYYQINTVCTDCNSRMGSAIDNKLINHKFIEFQRFLFNIKGKSGSIPNPFSGTHHIMDNPDRKVVLEIDSKGSLSPRLLPIVPNLKKEPIVDSFIIQVDKKDEGRIDEIIDKIILRNGIDKHRLTSTKIEREVDPYISITLNIDTQDFKIGMLKMAYEFAVDNIPEYFTDEHARTISKILYKCDFKDLVKKVLFFGSGFDKEILTPFQNLISFEEKNHYLILLSTKHGLICIINLFNILSIGIRLSNSTNYLKNDLLVGKNDLDNHSFKIFNTRELIEYTFTEMSYGFEYYFSDDQSQMEFELFSSQNILSHYHDDGHIAFYDSRGQIVYRSILDKLNSLSSRSIGDTINEMTSEYDLEEELYIKLLPQNKFYRVTKVHASRYRIKKL